MNVLSLFDGMSCGQLALNKANIKYNNYFSSEIDKYAIKVTQSNFPKTIQLGDIKDWTKWNLPKINLILAGSPCQGFSFAGKQLNFKDERSKLFFIFIDIMNFYEPDFFLFENVKMKKEYQNVISDYLKIQSIEINSALVSAQNRKRLYWTNIKNITQPEDKNILLKDIIENGYVDRDKSFCVDANYFKGGNLKRYFTKNSRQLVFVKPYKFNTILDKTKWRKLTPVECERLQTVSDAYTNFVSNHQRYKMLGNGWTVDVIAHILKNINDQ